MSGKQKRGRETVGDMIRSLGVVMVLVVAFFVFAQPQPSDKKEIRVIDPAVEIRSFTRAVPGGLVPGTLPAEWKPTVAVFEPSRNALRVGYNTPQRQYAEFFASPGPAAAFLAEAAGRDVEEIGPVQVGAVSWTQVRDADGSLSLHRTADGLTVVVGSLRSSASLDELRVLAGSLVAG